MGLPPLTWANQIHSGSHRQPFTKKSRLGIHEFAMTQPSLPPLPSSPTREKSTPLSSCAQAPNLDILGRFGVHLRSHESSVAHVRVILVPSWDHFGLIVGIDLVSIFGVDLESI